MLAAATHQSPRVLPSSPPPTASVVRFGLFNWRAYALVRASGPETLTGDGLPCRRKWRRAGKAGARGEGSRGSHRGGCGGGGGEGPHRETMSVDSKKESFRNYLVSSGAVDALTKALVTLYEEPEKPGNSIEFFKNALGAPTKEEYDTLLGEKEALEKEVAELKAKVTELESGGAAPEGEGEEAAEGEEAPAE